jgi:DDE_Tnp_1-associated
VPCPQRHHRLLTPHWKRSARAKLALSQVDNLADAFTAIPDPRKSRGRWHPLVAILLIAACAVTCDADRFTAIWQWADDAPPWVLARLRVRPDPLTGLLRPPSDRTLRRTLTRVDSHAVQQAAGAFIASRLTAVGLGVHVPTRRRTRSPPRTPPQHLNRRDRSPHPAVPLPGRRRQGAARRPPARRHPRHRARRS